MKQLTSSVQPAPMLSAKRLKLLKRKRNKFILGAVILLFVFILFSIFKGHKEKPTIVTIEKVSRKNITQLVNATGKIQPEVEVKISPEVAGEIIDLPVVDGQLVKKGQLLLRIKPDNYQAQVDQTEAAISSAKAVSIQNKAALDKSISDLRRSEELYQKKIMSESDITAARTTAQSAKAVYESSLYIVQEAESKLNQARDLLTKTTITSPLEGKITQVSNKLGERVVATGQFAGTDVMHVADMTHMEARVNVNENDIVNVNVGDKASIQIDAYPGQTIEGEVYQIANTAVTTGENTQEQVTNFEVRIRIALDSHFVLRPGMSATADIETASVSNVIAIPIQAVTMRDLTHNLSPAELEIAKAKDPSMQSGPSDKDLAELNKGKQLSEEKASKIKEHQVVFVKDHSKNIVHQREVITGIADNTNIEVKRGLALGEEIVTGPYSAITQLLKEGTSIKVQTSPTFNH